MVQQLKYGLCSSRKYSVGCVCAEIPCQGSANKPGAKQGAPRQDWEPPGCWGRNPDLLGHCRKVTFTRPSCRPELQGSIAWTLVRSHCPCVPSIPWEFVFLSLGRALRDLSLFCCDSQALGMAELGTLVSMHPSLLAGKNSQFILELSPGAQSHLRKKFRFLVWWCSSSASVLCPIHTG